MIDLQTAVVLYGGYLCRAQPSTAGSSELAAKLRVLEPQAGITPTLKSWRRTFSCRTQIRMRDIHRTVQIQKYSTRSGEGFTKIFQMPILVLSSAFPIGQKAHLTHDIAFQEQP